jgi:hypothetical protein
LKRSVTLKPFAARRTSGTPRELSAPPTVPPPPPPVVRGVKAAMTVRAAFRESVQVSFLPALAQDPPHPPNVWPAAGVAVSVAVEPFRCWTHLFSAPVAMHLPALVETAPLPVTVIESVPGAAAVNVAVTALVLVIETVHVGAVPKHAPPQPLNVAPAAGLAVRVTDVPDWKFALQATAPLPQLIAEPVTLPLPLTETESRNVGPPPPPLPVVNVALTDRAAFISTLQVGLVPVQAPPQPAKAAPAAGVAVSVTVAFGV